MTVLATIQGVCPYIGIDVPTEVFASTDREHVELASLANTMARRIARAHYWVLLSELKTMSGDGSTTAFDLPSDYSRMPKKQNIWSTRTQEPIPHVISSDEWLEISVRDYSSVVGAWTKIGHQIHIEPALTSSEDAKYYYVSDQLVLADGVSEGAATKIAFTLDTDSFRLDEELLKLGMIWQWKATKNLPYGVDMENYEDALAEQVGWDKGARIISVGKPRMLRGAKLAYPGTITP